MRIPLVSSLAGLPAAIGLVPSAQSTSRRRDQDSWAHSALKTVTIINAGTAWLMASLPSVSANEVPHPMDPRLPIRCPWPMCFRSYSRDAWMIKKAGEGAYQACVMLGVQVLVDCEGARKKGEDIERWAIQRDINECGTMKYGPVWKS
jgi:hypothetical protein